MSKKVYSLITLISSLVGLIVALIFYMPFDNSFRPWANYISDIGAGPIGAVITLGLMEGFIGVFVFLLLIVIAKENEKSTKKTLFLIFGSIAQASILLIAIFPLNPINPISYEIHRIIAILYFGFSAITDFFLGSFEWKTRKFSAIIIILSGVFSLLFTIGFILQEFGPIPKNALVYLTEWVYFNLSMLWLILKIIPTKKK